MPATLSAGAEVLERMDQSKLSGLHWKIMFISGMGFLTDAYDLFIIGVVMALLHGQEHLEPHPHAACGLRRRRRPRISGRRGDDRPDRAQIDPDDRLRLDGGDLRRNRLDPRRRKAGPALPHRLRNKLLLHRIRSQFHDLRLSRRDLPGESAHHRSRDRRRDWKARRLPRGPCCSQS